MWIDYIATYLNWRKGQALFNAIYSVDKELGDKIRGTKFDPFYLDKLIDDKFIKSFTKNCG